MGHPYRDPEPPRGRPCPRCPSVLTELVVESRNLLRCQSCGGMWLTREIFLDALIEPGLQGELQQLDRSRLGGGEPPAPMSCPICRTTMKRGEYASSGVTVDTCKRHGVWLDASELTRIIRFATANVPFERAEEPLPPLPDLHKALFPEPGGFWRALAKLGSRD